MRRCGREMLDRGHGDSMVRSPAGSVDIQPLGGAVARMLDGDGAGLDCGMTQRVKRTLRPHKAKPSAIGGSRRRADTALERSLPVIMLQLARAAARGSVAGGRRSRR